jgi:predicted nucleic acid-binding protein
MDHLSDTNILLRWSQPSDPGHMTAIRAIQRLWEGGDDVCIVLQNPIEFCNVATRPITANGFGLSIAEADRSIARIERIFRVLPETPDIYPEWRRLVVTMNVSGVQVYDARLAALMRVHHITHILTFNTRDFTRFPGIVAVHPDTLIKANDDTT